jgi:hypothetical protein
MPDPVTGAVIAKAAAAAGSETGAETGKLIERILGPAADEFGKALARSVAYRTRNFGRIADKAARKASADHARIVNARVAYTLLDEGSLCDDELMAEYLGGLLTGSRSHDGRDYRAVTWTKVVTGMSVLQVRAHYLLYREWAARPACGQESARPRRRPQPRRPRRPLTPEDTTPRCKPNLSPPRTTQQASGPVPAPVRLPRYQLSRRPLPKSAMVPGGSQSAWFRRAFRLAYRSFG